MRLILIPFYSFTKINPVIMFNTLQLRRVVLSKDHSSLPKFRSWVHQKYWLVVTTWQLFTSCLQCWRVDSTRPSWTTWHSKSRLVWLEVWLPNTSEREGMKYKLILMNTLTLNQVNNLISPKSVIKLLILRTCSRSISFIEKCKHYFRGPIFYINFELRRSKSWPNKVF